MTEPCIACAKHTANFVPIGAGRVPACSIDCYRESQRPLPKPTDAERRTARPLPGPQRAALDVPETVPVMAYVPQRPSNTLPIAADNGAIYLQARRLPDGTLVVDRFENYTTPGHSWRAALVRAVPARTAPQAVHAVPPPPTPAAPATPVLALSAPIGADAHPVHLVPAPVDRVLACGHASSLALAWPGTARRAPLHFCGAQCAEKHIGAQVRVVSDIGAALLAPATGTQWLTLPAESPLLRVYKLHPQLRAPAPNMIHAQLAQEAARAIAQHRLTLAPVGAPGPFGDDSDDESSTDADYDDIYMSDDDEDRLLSSSFFTAKTPSARAELSPLDASSPPRPKVDLLPAPSKPLVPFRPGALQRLTLPSAPASSSSKAAPSKRPSDAGTGGRPKMAVDDPLATLPVWVLRAAMAAADPEAGAAAEDIQRKADNETRALAHEWWSGASEPRRSAMMLELARGGHVSEIVAVARRDPALVQGAQLEKIYDALRSANVSAGPLLDALEEDDRAVLAQLALAAGDAPTVTQAVIRMSASDRERFYAAMRTLPAEKREAARGARLSDLPALVRADDEDAVRALMADLNLTVDEMVRDNKSLLQLAIDADVPRITLWAAGQSKVLDATRGRERHTVLTGAIVAKHYRAMNSLLRAGAAVRALELSKLAAADEWDIVIEILRLRAGKLLPDAQKQVREARGAGSLVFQLLGPNPVRADLDRAAVLGQLLQLGLSAEGTTGTNESTALHLAALRDLPATVPLLVEAGVPVDATTLPFTVSGNTVGSETALFIAVRMGHVAVAAELLRAGADITIPNLAGLTVLQVLGLESTEKPIPRIVRARRDEMARLFSSMLAPMQPAATPSASPAMSPAASSAPPSPLNISSRLRFVPL